MSYVAALDRKKTDISVFQKEEKASGLNKVVNYIFTKFNTQ